MSARAEITEVVTQWPGVTTSGPGERGEFSFMLGRHEVGHLHGDRVAHFSFKRELRRGCARKGGSSRTRSRPRLGLGARRIDGPDDVAAVIELLRVNYDRLAAAG